MDMWELAKFWGPAIPILVVLLKAHHDLVYRSIPEALKSIKSEVRESEARAVLRHDEHMKVMDKIARAIEGRSKPPPRKGRGRGDSNGRHGPRKKTSAPRRHDAAAGLRVTQQDRSDTSRSFA